jgi:hypothetical protein
MLKSIAYVPGYYSLGSKLIKIIEFIYMITIKLIEMVVQCCTMYTLIRLSFFANIFSVNLKSHTKRKKKYEFFGTFQNNI